MSPHYRPCNKEDSRLADGICAEKLTEPHDVELTKNVLSQFGTWKKIFAFDSPRTAEASGGRDGNR